MNSFTNIIVLTVVSVAPLAAEQPPEINLDFEVAEVTIDPSVKEPVGLSINNPVVFDKVKKYNELKFAQNEYVRKHHEGYHVAVDVVTLSPKGRLIQGLGLEQEGQKPILIYFDVDDVYRKTKKIEDKELRKRVEELLKDQHNK